MKLCNLGRGRGNRAHARYYTLSVYVYVTKYYTYDTIYLFTILMLIILQTTVDNPSTQYTVLKKKIASHTCTPHVEYMYVCIRC